MFGKILEIHEYTIVLENISNKVNTSLVGVHVIFEGKYNIVAEITEISSSTIDCLLVGEFIDGNFYSGILHKPTETSIIRFVNKEEVIKLVGIQDVDSSSSVYIGKSITYDGYNVSARLNDLFSNHFAILGNTGSGKSCSVSRFFQNIFYRKKYIPINSKFVLFDVYGEYHTALSDINKTKFCRYKTYTTDVNSKESEIVKIPPYFLEVDDIALLLKADNPSQLPLIEKALKYVYLFTEDEEKVIAYKNNIIAKALLDILTSGRKPTQIRDQVFAVLTTFKTKNINLECQIIQPGYVRTLSQCLKIDATGKINAMQIVTEYLERFINDNLKLEKSMVPRNYKLSDLYMAFEFALISEGVLKSDRVYDMNNILKVRLDTIMNSDYSEYFEVNEYISKEEYIERLFLNFKGEKAQIINFNLNYVDERFAKTLTKIYSKLFLDYAVSVKDKKDFSVNIILEEAHRYVNNDNDLNVIGYNIFDRITKEGRKYGVLLGLITQRPCDLSNTALSQCSNYIVLRMFHPDDLNIVKNITHSISQSDIEKLKSFSPGIALCFGNAFNIPLFCKIDKPTPMPCSNNIEISSKWILPVEDVEKSFVIQSSDVQKNTIDIIQ